MTTVFRIDLGSCINCSLCRRACPTECINYFSTGHRTHVIDPSGCIGCDICVQVCPVDCIDEDSDYKIDPAQLEDFEDARPPRLLDASQNLYRIQGGRLVLEGSTGIRHKIEGTGEFRAKFYVRLGAKTNVGTVFTEPILSEHYILLNLFDDRMYKSGSMFLCGVGMH